MSLISEKYYNRDLSWLRFNHRVLQEAADCRNPLYERIKFLAIFSSNLDEFFKVRVSDIRQIKQLDKSIRKKLISKPNKLLKQIKTEVDQQQQEFGKIFHTQIVPELAKNHIQIINETAFNEGQQAFSKEYYQKLVEEGHIRVEEAPFVSDEVLYLFACKEDKNIWVKIDRSLPRFVTFSEEAGEFYISFIDDIIRYNLQEEYGVPFYAVKVSRDAELYIDNEFSGNLLEKIKEALPNRDTGQVTRILIDERAPKEYIKKIEPALDVNDTDLILGGRYHNFKDLFGFPNPTKNEALSFADLPPIRKTDLDAYDSLFDAILEKDRLFCYPYESFDGLVRFIEEASQDEAVTKIKMTLYRVSDDSEVAQALIQAAENGKEVTVFIETKARFDEANNIKWGAKMQEKGIHVSYSYPGIKVHSKILFVERVLNEQVQEFVYIGTGNFNEENG